MKLTRVPFLFGSTSGTADPPAAYAAAGHLLATPEGVWAYYVLAGVDYLGRSADEQAVIARAQAHRWAELCGHRVQLRQTSTPWPHQVWADHLKRTHPHPDYPRTPATLTHRLRDQPDGTPFDALLGNAQALVSGLGKRKSGTVLGVLLNRDRVKSLADLELVLAREPIAHAKLESVRRARHRIDTAVAKEGWGGTPASCNFVAWLIHASLGLGADVPAALVNYPGRNVWDAGEVPGFTEPVEAHSDPYELTVQLEIARDNRKVTRHVATQVVTDFGPRPVGRAPLLAWTLDYDAAPLEVVGVFEVIDGAALKKEWGKVLHRARQKEKHALEHDDDPDFATLRAIDDARVTADQIENGDSPTRTRLLGKWFVAVSADNESEALDEARALRVAAEEEQAVILAHNFDQYRKYRAFTPGEPAPDTRGHLRQVPARYAAAGLTPNVSVEAGDPSGFLLGPVRGGHDLGLLDPLAGSRGDGSGVCLTCGNQGSGKSALAGALLYWTARLGIRSVGVDPAGLWRALTQLPDLKADSRFIDVAAKSVNPGALSPTLLIPEPRRRDYDDETQWREAASTSKAERIELLVDTFTGLLPWDYRQSQHDLTALLMTVCADVGGDYGTDPWEYVARLDGNTAHGGLGQQVAGLLRATTAMKQGALIFPEQGRSVDPDQTDRLINSATLTVISTHGLAMPPSGSFNRALWTPSQQATVPVLGLVARLATLAMYSDRRSPTNITIDELRLIAAGGSGFASFINRTTVDSRKWFAFVNLIFQAMKIVQDIDENIGNLAGMALVGRLDQKDAEEAREVLRDTDPASSVADAISSQASGEFHWRDWQGRLREVYVEREWWPQDLRAALDTTPGRLDGYHPASPFGVAP